VRQKRIIDDDCKKAVRPYQEAKRILTSKLMNYRAEQQRKEREAREAAEAERQKREQAKRDEEERRRKISISKGGTGDITPVAEPEPVPEPESFAATDTTKVQKRWDIEIVDPFLVPREYLLVKESMIRQAMFDSRDKDGVPQIQIPGVKIFQREIGIFA